MNFGRYILVWLLDTVDRSDWRTCKLPDTLRWFNTAGALLLGTNHMDPNNLGGVKQEEVFRTMKMLDSWWDITDHDSAWETMSELLDGGMRARLNREMELFSIYRKQGLEKGSIDEKAVKKNPSNRDKLLPIWQEHKEKTFLGWDLCRAVLITTWCYRCSYLSFEEMMEIAVPAGQMLQAEFSNWDEVMQSYLCGLFAWMDPKTKEDRRAFRLRVRMYHLLHAPKGPFANMKFQTPLSKTLPSAEQDALHHM